MKYVVFFRNLNLGRPGSPTRRQLMEAFADAGGVNPESFLTNGTVVLSADRESSAWAILTRARQTLNATCGLVEPAFLCSFRNLSAAVARRPFAAVKLKSFDQACASFMSRKAVRKLAVSLPLSGGGVEVLRVMRCIVLSVSRGVGRVGGDPTAFLERILSVPATTRNWNTVVRLVDKFG